MRSKPFSIRLASQHSASRVAHQTGRAQWLTMKLCPAPGRSHISRRFTAWPAFVPRALRYAAGCLLGTELEGNQETAAADGVVRDADARYATRQ